MSIQFYRREIYIRCWIRGNRTGEKFIINFKYFPVDNSIIIYWFLVLFSTSLVYIVFIDLYNNNDKKKKDEDVEKKLFRLTTEQGYKMKKKKKFPMKSIKNVTAGNYEG